MLQLDASQLLHICNTCVCDIVVLQITDTLLTLALGYLSTVTHVCNGHIGWDMFVLQITDTPWVHARTALPDSLCVGHRQTNHAPTPVQKLCRFLTYVFQSISMV